jgi:CHC2-type zinc finger protein
MPASKVQSIDLDGGSNAGGADLSQGAPQARGAARTLDRAVSAAGHNQMPIDFQLIKERVTLAMVLSRDGVLSSLRKLGSQHSTTCPLHGGSDPRQFVVHLPTNRWFCFSPQCNRGGGVIDYVMLREHVDARRAAELIAEWFAIGPPRHLPPRPRVQRRNSMSNDKPSHNVFIVENREADSDADQAGFWTKVGSAWPHKDGKGLNVLLKPNIAVSGRLVLREWDDEQRSRQKPAA